MNEARRRTESMEEVELSDRGGYERRLLEWDMDRKGMLALTRKEAGTLGFAERHGFTWRQIAQMLGQMDRFEAYRIYRLAHRVPG